MKKEKILAIAIIVMVLTVAIWAAFRPDLIPAFDLVLLAGLIGVTTVYAYSAIKQADASVEMAKAMMKPTLNPELKPLVNNSIKEGQRVELGAIVYNDGAGAAYDVECWIEDRNELASKSVIGEKAAILRPGGKIVINKEWSALVLPQPCERFFVIKYRDVESEYQIRQPFVLRTKENNETPVDLGSISKKMIRKINLEDELP